MRGLPRFVKARGRRRNRTSTANVNGIAMGLLHGLWLLVGGRSGRGDDRRAQAHQRAAVDAAAAGPAVNFM